MAYNAVVGAHHDELVEEERQTAARKKNQDPGQDVGGGGQRKVGVPAEKGARAVFGDGAAEALKEVGRDEDQMAKRMGYRSYEDYLEKCKEYLGG